MARARRVRFPRIGAKMFQARRPSAGRAGLLLVWMTLMLLLAAYVSAAAAREPAAPIPTGAAAPTPAYDPEKQFTILSLEPDAAKEVVRIAFSRPIPLEVLKKHLRLLPPVKLDWRRSTLSDDGVLTLRSAFKFGTGYLVSLPDNLKVAGRAYVQTRHSFSMPDLPPKVEFVEQKRVIERDSRQLLQVRVQNLNSLVFEGLRVPPLLLPLALALERTPGDWDKGPAQLKAAADQLAPLVQGKKPYRPFLGQVLLEKQLFATAGEKNRARAFSLPLSFRQGKESGALELIRVRENRPEGPAPAPAAAPRLFRITDLGLTYKLGDNSLLLWVTSLKTSLPVADAQVLALTKDLEVFPLGQTDQDGILIYPGKELEGLSLKTLGQFGPVKRLVARDQVAFLLAGTDNDVSFVEVRPQGNLRPEGIRQVRVGDKFRNLKGQVFTERGVYRPGETVHFKGAVREYREGRIVPPADESCTFEITSPKGEQVFSQELRLSDFGTAAGQMTVAPHLPLGTYTLKMRFGPGEPEAEPGRRGRRGEGQGEESQRQIQAQTTITFLVEEFKPPRHFVEIGCRRFSRPDPRYVNLKEVGEYVRFDLSGVYYAGGPVKHGQVRWKVYKSKTDYRLKEFEDFTFGYAGEEQGELIESGQTILDDKGRAELEFPLDRPALSGRHGLLLVATVVDFDGAAASAKKPFQVEPDTLVGIGRHAETVSAGEEQVLRVIAAHKGKAVKTGAVQAEVLEQSSAYVAKRNDKGDVYWDHQEVWRRTFTTELPLHKGEARFRFDFAWGGRFMLAFTYTDRQGRSFTSATAYQVEGDYHGRDYQERDRAYQSLALAADRAAYEPGQTARLTVRPRRPVSRYLLTLEQDGLLQHRVLAAPKGTDPIEIPIRAEYAPNVYVSVLGLTPRGEYPVFAGRYDTEAPGFFWGNLNLSVRREVERLTVKISPAAKDLKAEPGAAVELDFQVLAPDGKGVDAEMAVAVVDERILALTGFKTPSLEDLARFDKPLGVYTGELRTLLMHQTPFYPARNEPMTGGSGLAPGAEGLMGKIRKRFDPVAYFNAALRTDAQGRAKVSFTLPDTMTTYRVYTVVLDRGSRFAAAERPLLAAKDFYLEPGLPGFFTQGDRFKFLVAAVNAGDRGGPLQFRVEAEGGLKLTAAPPPGPLPPRDSLKLAVNGEALAAGAATARFGAAFEGQQDAVELPLKINSGQIRETTVLTGSISGPGEINFALPAPLTAVPWDQVGWGEVKAVLTLSGSPFLRMTEAINYLLTYPYGCVEQTASGVLGLAALRGVIKDGLAPGVSLADADKFLTKGVERLLTMQTDSGGFAYWPGQREAHPYGTLYAGAALGLARANGLTVPAEAVTKVNNYLKEHLTKLSHNGAAFACYVLSLNEALDKATLLGVAKDGYDRMNREGKLFLLLATRQAGGMDLKDLQAKLKPLLEAKPGAPDAAADDFQARYRGPALAVLAGKAIVPEDPLTKQAALTLLGGLDSQGIWTSTSDTGWALLALGEYFKGAAFATAPAELSVTQPDGDEWRLTLDPKSFRTVPLSAETLIKNPVVQVDGPAGRTWLYKVEVTAPRPDLGETGAAQGFKVWKTIKNTDGAEDIKVGDLVKVTVFMEVAGKGQRYVVLDDPLPAGLMAVNTAFKTEEIGPARQDGEEEDHFEYLTAAGHMRYRPNFFEMRQDRVLAFRDQVFPGLYLFEYYARAGCEGDFVLPATKAAAMYAPAVHGYSPKGRITIKGR